MFNVLKHSIQMLIVVLQWVVKVKQSILFSKMCSHLTAEMPTFKTSLTQEQFKHPIHLFIVHFYTSDIIVSQRTSRHGGALSFQRMWKKCVSYLGPKFYTEPLTCGLKEDLSFNSCKLI